MSLGEGHLLSGHQDEADVVTYGVTETAAEVTCINGLKSFKKLNTISNDLHNSVTQKYLCVAFSINIYIKF